MTKMTRVAKMTRVTGLMPLLVGIAMLAACDADTVGPEIPVVATVEISPSAQTLTVGDTLRLSAVAKATDGTALAGRQVSWASLDGTYAEVEGSGATALVTARRPGSASITATVDGKVGTTTLTVVAPPPVPATIELSFGEGWMEVGEEAHLNATVHTADGSVMDATGLVWETDAAEVAGVTPSEQPRVAKIIARGEGTALITARIGDIQTSATVTVLPAGEPASGLQLNVEELTVERGKSVPLQASVWKADGAYNPAPVVHWMSSDTAVATVAPGADGRTVLTARAPGVVTVRALSGGKADSARIAVVAPLNVGEVVITSGDVSLWKTQISLVKASVLGPTGATLSGAPVSWSVEDTTVAEIDAQGYLMALRVGATRVFAESGGVKGKVTLTVKEWPSDGRLEVNLKPDVDPVSGGGRQVVVTETTEWTDSTGVEHAAFVWLRGGTISFNGNGRYTQRLEFDVMISGFGGIMRRVGQRVSETQGQIGYHLMDPFWFFLHPDDGTAVLQMKPRVAGVWTIDQSVGNAGVLSWLWTMD